jgi:quercetin dioxygenase-like cupin family protein
MTVATNLADVDLAEVRGAADATIHWQGGYAAFGGHDSQQSATVYFTLAPGERLGRHTDTAEETQFIVSGAGELRLDEGPLEVAPGDVIVLTEGTAHDLVNTGGGTLEVVGFFSAPRGGDRRQPRRATGRGGRRAAAWRSRRSARVGHADAARSARASRSSGTAPSRMIG